MKTKETAIYVTVLCLVSSLTACGGGGSGDGSVSLPPPAPTTNAAGIWNVEIYRDAVPLNLGGMIADQNAEGRWGDNMMQFVLSDISGTSGSISATITAITLDSLAFMDGSTVTTGTLTGTMVEKVSFVGSYSLNSGDAGAVSMSNERYYLYDDGRTADIARIEGCWTPNVGNTCLFFVEPDGSFAGGGNSGCAYSGVMSVINPAYNLYRVAITVANCLPTAGRANGDFNGLGYVVDTPGVGFHRFGILADDGQVPMTMVGFR